MKVAIFSDNELMGEVSIVDEELSFNPAGNEFEEFVRELYNPRNQTLEEFMKALPVRIRGRIWAQFIDE